VEYQEAGDESSRRQRAVVGGGMLRSAERSADEQGGERAVDLGRVALRAEEGRQQDQVPGGAAQGMWGDHQAWHPYHARIRAALVALPLMRWEAGWLHNTTVIQTYGRKVDAASPYAYRADAALPLVPSQLGAAFQRKPNTESNQDDARCSFKLLADIGARHPHPELAHGEDEQREPDDPDHPMDARQE